MDNIATAKPDATGQFNQILNKVPEVTIFFWVIKVLCTTVGETASDFLNVNLNLGLTGTSIVAGIILIITLFFQLRAKKYTPFLYWINVVLISVFGTLVTDNLTDSLHVPLELSTILFSILLIITFGIWYIREKTLSMHSIYTRSREAFYWLAVLFTFALGTASGDLMAEKLGLGYGPTGIIIITLVAIFAIAWRFGLNAILAFWLIYIMTRPLGASLGDYLTQSKAHGGLGLGATVTSSIFVGAIILTVLYLAITKKDVSKKDERLDAETNQSQKSVFIQVLVVGVLLITGTIGGYKYQENRLNATTADQAIPASGTKSATTTQLGDLSTFQAITQDMLNSVNSGDIGNAKKRADDLEYEWDSAEARLKPKDSAKWTEIDGNIDKALREVRAVNPNQQASKSALEILLNSLK